MNLKRYLPIILSAAVLGVVVLLVAIPGATGRQWPAWTGLAGKTIWDAAQLIIVPISLALIAYLLSNRQRQEDREIARAQREQDLRIADERRRNDSEIALNREREDALQAYLSAMTTLLLEHNMSDDKVAVIAQARTLSLLPRLDGKRKATVLRFLAGSKLISRTDQLLSLNGADFSGMQVGVSLAGVSLGGVNLHGCKLPHSSIRDSDLQFADLSDVDLSSSDLFGSDLRGANLDGADLSDTVLVKTNFASGIPARASESVTVARNNARSAEERWLKTLAGAQFKAARYDFSTGWPKGFDAKAAGALDISD
jgi:uncharacterized protein YjbI with pentapeptide repeats